MKTILKLVLAAAALIAPAGIHGLLAQVDTCNYIMTTTHLGRDSTLAARRVVSYFDGLGRQVQTLRRGGAGNGDDLVDRTEYDSLGRTWRYWNPVAIGANGGREVSGATVSAYAQQYYSDNAAYTQTEYDGTPLNRIRKVTGPGEAWHCAGKGVKSNYLTNTNSTGTDSLHCVKFGFTLIGNTGIGFTRNGLWPAGSLTVDRTEDEDGRTLWVFKDMRGLTVLERRLAEPVSGNSPAIYADTYYLYDNAGRLTAVLPPELSDRFLDGSWGGATEQDPTVEGFAYQYRYDSRGRMIAKKLPGADWTYYVYDEGDRLVLTQDGNQRERGEWSFHLQDLLGRECLTGVLTGNYNAFSNPLGNVHVRAVRDRSSGNYGNLHGYTVEGLSLPSGAEVLTVNWWDDYSFLGREDGMDGSSYGYTAPESSGPYGSSYEASAAGFLTGHWSRTLGEVRDIGTVGPAVMETMYYDDHGRKVYHVKGYPSGRRTAERSGYDFVGNLTTLKRTMYDGAGAVEHTEEYAYEYDSWGRLQNTVHTLDGGTSMTLASNSYDSVGRLSGTERGRIGTTPGPAALSSSYTYNVRGWLTGIIGPLFSEHLTYETPRTGSLPAQWSGNISGVQWGAGDARPYRYDFTYDLLGRLKEASYGGNNAVIRNSRTYDYDLNGNLTARESDEAASLYSGAWLDWTWNSGSGNRPEAWHQQRNDGAVYNPWGPSGPSQLADEVYTYDAVGNRTAVKESVQGDTLSVVRYNLLNLPMEYVGVQGDTVRYVYSADGEKLYVREKPSGEPVQGTEYVANYRVENGTVTMIHTDAGYYTPLPNTLGSGPAYTHIWYLKDHLGNNRVLASERGAALARYHYDPFGDKISVEPSVPSGLFLSGMKESPYTYGGKEWSATTSTYDFEARYLSPSFHRFTTMDPLCERYYSISPYAYCANNPVNLVDPEGTQWYSYVDDNGEIQYIYSEGAMSDDEKKQYNDLQYLGYYYRDTNTDKYYSLFGLVLDWTDSGGAPSDGQIYEKIDRLLIARATMSDDTKVSMYISGLPLGENRDLGRGRPIIYEGLTFTTCPVTDFDGENKYFGNVYWNTKDWSRPDVDTSLSAITELPTNIPHENRSFTNSNIGYWLKASNFRGAKRGFQTLQLLFTRYNAAQFKHSYNNLFRGHPYNH